MAAPSEEVPHAVQIPATGVSAVIGQNGSTIKRLLKATGCKIEVPPREEQASGDNASVEIKLIGTPEQRQRASKAILDVVAGGDPEDCAGTAEGAMVIPHGLDNFDKQFWLSWRLVPTEAAHKVRADVSRSNVRLWSEHQYGYSLLGAAAQAVHTEVKSAINEALELIEIVVNAQVEFDTDYARYDPSVSPLVDKYGVLVHVPRPEDGCVPIRITGPAEATRDAALLLEAGYVKGKFTASVLQLAGQVQGMTEQMAADFDNDLIALEEEYKVKVHRSQVLLSIIGTTSDSACRARHTIREMLEFYYPDSFSLLRGFKKSVIEKLREDTELRVLTARSDCAVSFEPNEGTIWICGKCRSLVQQRIDAVQKKWNAEHWEYDLSDYGAAMWLLGPRGSGEYLARIQSESGCNVRVCPNNLKVWAEGHPAKIKQAERLVLQAMQALERKKQTEADAPLKPKALLSDVPAHMRSILEKLAELDEKKRLADNKQRIVDRERSWALERAEAGLAPLEDNGVGGPVAETANRDRSRSPSQPRAA